MRMRFAVSGAVVAALVAAPLAATAGAGGHPSQRIVVTPSSGFTGTRFTVGFRTPDRTGRIGQLQRHDELSLSAPGNPNACVTNGQVIAPDARAGARVRATLDPARLGGHWCAGTYQGQIVELESPICPHGEFCPTYVIVRRTVGRFTFHVRANSDVTPPTFAGLQSAMACTPGPQRPRRA